MNWQHNIVFNDCEYEPANENRTYSRMKPGLTDTYDRELREKASIRGNPVPPDCMGVEGEYDPFGLAKRVAKALDEQPQTADINTLTLRQKGNTIVYVGQVSNQQALDAVVATTQQVDGTHAVATDQVNVASS
ncbi:hypothetical protein [Leptolyngbya iicbica]